MRPQLMFPDSDFDPDAELPWNEAALVQDLELETLLRAMSAGDQYLGKVARHAVLCSLHDPERIRYRQDILRDCLAQPDLVRELYATAVDAIAAERKIFGGLLNTPETVLHRSMEVLEAFLGRLGRVRSLVDQHATGVSSEGLRAFVHTVQQQLDDDYFHLVEEHLETMRFKKGLLISAKLGSGNKGQAYTVRTPHRQPSLLDRVTRNVADSRSFTIAERDEAGARALGQLRDRGLRTVAKAVAESTDHVLGFFQALRAELGFYLGCLNLHEEVSGRHTRWCFPIPLSPGEPSLRATGLYDVCLALTTTAPVVSNDVDADGKQLVMITGANQGGKSTLLRSIGLAQLMMQAGMFVTAEVLSASICSSVLTHYKREEDRSMTSGKLDEELARMSDIVDHLTSNHLTSNALLLCNESFAATNEREGSQIAAEILRAVLEHDVRVVFVTHLYDLAHRTWERHRADTLFLRAERGPQGSRPFRLRPAEPLPTSFGRDVYERVFGSPPEKHHEQEQSCPSSQPSKPPRSSTPEAVPPSRSAPR